MIIHAQQPQTWRRSVQKFVSTTNSAHCAKPRACANPTPHSGVGSRVPHLRLSAEPGTRPCRCKAREEKSGRSWFLRGALETPACEGGTASQRLNLTTCTLAAHGMTRAPLFGLSFETKQTTKKAERRPPGAEEYFFFLWAGRGLLFTSVSGSTRARTRRAACYNGESGPPLSG